MSKSRGERIRVTIAQIPPQKRLSKIKEIIEGEVHSDLLVFPEGTLCTRDLRIVNIIRGYCVNQDTSVVIGIIYANRGRLYNYAYYISAEQVETYQKIHVHWTEDYVPGKKFRVVATPFGKLGLLICYDATFQESGRVLALEGAEIIVVISATPAPFPSKYIPLSARSMAYTNQVFVVNCQRPGSEYVGHSVIVRPGGDLVVELGRHEQVVSKLLDLSLVAKVREREKIFPYRRPRLYGPISVGSPRQ